MTAIVNIESLGRFVVGEQPVFTARWFAVAGGLADPTTVKFITRSPGGTETVYTYGSSGAVTKTSTGIYRFVQPQLTSAHAGVWHVRCTAAGDVVGAGEVTFECVASGFTTPLP